MTAAHAPGSSSSSTEVRNRNRCTTSDWRAQHLFDEEVAHDSDAARELRKETIRIGLAPERDRRHLHARHPSVGAIGEYSRRVGGEVDAERVDQAVDFVGREPKLGLANLEATTVGPQPMERERRVAPAAGHDARAGRQPFHQPRDQRAGVAGDMHVVEHENGRLPLQPSQHRVDHDHEIGIGIAEELNDIQPTVALCRPQRGTDMSPEHDRVTVEFLAADPRRSGTPLTHPCRQHDALARARRRHDGGERPIGARAQDVEQPRRAT